MFSVLALGEPGGIETRTLAEGHYHRSLGQRPRKLPPTTPVWPKAIITQVVFGKGGVNMAFGQTSLHTHTIPGALPQATVERRPSAKRVWPMRADTRSE